MTSEAEQQFESTLAPWRERVVMHPLYAHLHDEASIRLFMEAHVFAVWDFQSLLKALQRLVTCVEVPWFPTSDPQARRLLNEIVLDEESDQAPGGGYLSHFEIYLQAMRECGANVTLIQTFLGRVSAGLPVEQALDASVLPPGVGPFVRATMAIARSTEPHRVAAAFAYGREEITPAMFRLLTDRLAELSPQLWGTLRYYLDRHIGTDRDRHGPQARLLVRRLCGNDEILWSEAAEAARTSLEARARFWDAIVLTLTSKAEENMQEKNAMKPTRDALLERFLQAFPEAAIQVDDESHLHVGHVGAEGGAGHFRVRVVDARFNGLQRIARHRLVYDAVSDWIPERVHALNIIAMTLEEAGHA